MMSALHLLWIVPISVSIGCAIMAIFVGSKY